ncbi:diadenosine tetraphosphate hydrolase [Micromonospora sp. CPCC 206060]|uniref:diadenosine tetraphosphate hydrolase n=1 Tax=Micromonospora sp. CPCC 206060 TaxID=3122406 RepID=UPI002FF2E3AF
MIGDTQFLPGYCVFLADDPSVDRLTDLPRARRLAFLADMDLVGEAVQRVCSRRDTSFRRVNYEILGNLEAVLHAHIYARYDWEPPELVKRPVARYSATVRNTSDALLGPQHDSLRAELTTEIRLLASNYAC